MLLDDTAALAKRIVEGSIANQYGVAFDDAVPDGRGVLVRILRVGLDGTDREINAGEYGATPPEWSVADTGPEGGYGCDASSGDGHAMRLYSDVRMGIDGNRAHGRHTMHEGEKVYCALSWNDSALGRAKVVTLPHRGPCACCVTFCVGSGCQWPG